jgi:hypothetical protein
MNMLQKTMSEKILLQNTNATEHHAWPDTNLITLLLVQPASGPEPRFMHHTNWPTSKPQISQSDPLLATTPPSSQ